MNVNYLSAFANHACFHSPIQYTSSVMHFEFDIGMVVLGNGTEDKLNNKY